MTDKHEEGSRSLTVMADGASMSVVVNLVKLELELPLLRSSVEKKIVPGDYDPSFENGDLWPKLYKGKPGSISVAPEQDEEGTFILGGHYRTVLPETVVVKSADGGRTFKRGEDYCYEPVFGKVAAIDGRLGAAGKDQIQVACTYVTQRLDLVQVDGEGKPSVKRGEAALVCPQLPQADEDAHPLAGIYVAPWMRDGAFVVSQEDIFPIEPAPPIRPHNPGAVSAARERLASGGKLTIGFVGDSVTLGAEAGAWWEDLWTKKNSTYVSRLVVGLRERFPTATVSPIHAAQGGATIKAAAGLFDDVIAPTKVDLALIAFGLNDAYGPIGGEPQNPRAAFKQEVRAIVTKAKGIGAEVILVSPMQPNPWLKCPLAERIVNYRDVLRELADEEQVGFADVYSEWMRQASHGVPPFSQLHNWINHPGPEAHAVYSDLLMRFFENQER